MRKNSFLLILLSCVLLFMFPASIYAETQPASAENVTIDPLNHSYSTGGTVTISGTTAYSEVTVKVMAPDKTNLFFDIVGAAGGKYTTSFTIPGTAEDGTYHVAAGKGSDVKNASFTVATVSTPSPSGGGSNPNAGKDSSKPQAPSTNTVEFKSTDIPQPQNGIIVLNVTIPNNQNSIEVLLPGNLAELAGEHKVQLVWGSASLLIPKEVLESLAKLIPSGKLASYHISLQIHQLTSAEADGISSAGSGNGLTVKAASAVLELTLSVKDSEGQRTKLEQFAKPVVLSLKLNGPGSPLMGMYFIPANKKMEYAGGKISGDTLSADLLHFSQYGVFSYDKTYSDVAANHWAYNVIKVLSARHIVDGISETSFAPGTNVTRAEFVAMLTRHLKLAATAPIQLEDVKPESWYADAVAAAYSNGLVEGISATRFGPDRKITRQEMGAMITRAYSLVTGRASKANPAAFKDSGQISGWAKDSVNFAVQEGLMIGRTADSFAPKQQTTRAEAAQVIYNLINKQ